MSDDSWSAIAADWVPLWGSFAGPVWHAVLSAVPGPADRTASFRMLDVGCGGGEFLRYARGVLSAPPRDASTRPVDALAREHAERERPVAVVGIDPAPGMLTAARTNADSVVQADVLHLPWRDAAFDLVTAVNSLQFAEDTDDALAEMIRVTAPDGRIAVANWADRALNDLDALERALAGGAGQPDGDLRVAGGLAELLVDGGLTVVASGLVEVPWEVPDAATLVRGILLGEDPALAPEVVAAADPYRLESGGYRLINHFRFAVGSL
ncbi:class I SAM-dependent methyltransferase [Actinoplanes sp. N902-109]|uniref:class I SAM-dependent methyltransferase n=1 Tax=Actinoplanes sp. (strain N902-109) TaxID=649831 RepID=UPI0003293460|nr:class I SAM-dependent methyltransferase [Actinoplanes sp. N902-109]AGL14673.1 type 11 methyltransferase [Actinoplanes sp. N902-109]